MTTIEQYDVFLSYSKADKQDVQTLAHRLRQEAKLTPYFDWWYDVPGEPILPAAERALGSSDSVAVIVGPSGLSPWAGEQMQAALNRAIRSRNECRVIPVLLPGAQETDLTDLLALRVWVDFGAGLDDAEAFDRLVAGILGQPPEQPGPFRLDDEPAPYPGLLSFTEQQSAYFFGREAEKKHLLERVRASPLVAVVGASGSGKSSLVMAGLLPDLPADWHALVLVPGVRPLRALADHLAAMASPNDLEACLQRADKLETRLAERADGLSTTLSNLLARPHDFSTLLIVVDQFEELFTQVASEPDGNRHQQHQFIDNLVDAAQTLDERLRIVLTLRADFVQNCLEFPNLRRWLEANQLLLGPMDEDALREAIVKPAQKVGAMFERGLVRVLVEDMRHQPSALPLMQFALAQLWQKRHSVWLTHAAYEEIGGIGGALDRTADTVYEKLDENEKRLVRNLFLRLVALGEEGNDTRRRVRRDELHIVDARPEELDDLVQTLSQPSVRLIAADAGSLELAHEALIERWGLLRQWLEEDRAALRTHRRLTQRAQEWEALGREEGSLLRGSQLAGTEEWAAEHDKEMNILEQEFLLASLAQRDREAQDKERQRQLELELARQRAAEAEARAQAQARTAKRLRWLVATLAVLLLIPALLGFKEIQRRNSNWQPVAGFPRDPTVALTTGSTSGDGSVAAYCAGTLNIGVGCTRDGRTWNIYQQDLPIGSPGSGAGGPWLNTTQGITALAVDARNPDRLFAFVAEHGVYRSENGGIDWEPTAQELFEREGCEALAVYEDLVLALLGFDNRSLYASYDSGARWEKVAGPGTALSQELFAIHMAADGETVYAGGTGGLYSSPTGPPWNWKQEAELSTTVEYITPIPGVEGAYYLAAAEENRDKGYVYRYQAGQSLASDDPLATVNSRPLVLAPDPDPTHPTALYVLLTRLGLFYEVVAIAHDGTIRSLGNRPGWFFAQAYDLLVAPHPSRADPWLLLGHDDGLFEFTKAP